MSVRPARFRVGKGTTFHVTLSEAASLRIAIERRTAGRRVRGKCRKVTKKNHKRKKCTRFVRAGSLSAAAADGGNSIAFSGKLGGKSLKPGRYRATITATDEARNASAPVEATFQVLKKKPKRKRP